MQKKNIKREDSCQVSGNGPVTQEGEGKGGGA